MHGLLSARSAFCSPTAVPGQDLATDAFAPSGVHLGVRIFHPVGDGLLTLIFLIMPRETRPDLLQIHVLTSKQHLVEYSFIAITLLIFLHHELAGDRVGQGFL